MGIELIIAIIIIVAVILVIRLFGAWMLRIDEVIKYQKEILAELKKGNTTNKVD
jgi:flagellar biosynthesis protein FliQ